MKGNIISVIQKNPNFPEIFVEFITKLEKYRGFQRKHSRFLGASQTPTVLFSMLASQFLSRPATRQTSPKP